MYAFIIYAFYVKYILYNDQNQLNLLIFCLERKKFLETRELSVPYAGHFNENLIRGGFPQTALVDEYSSGTTTTARRYYRQGAKT